MTAPLLRPTTPVLAVALLVAAAAFTPLAAQAPTDAAIYESYRAWVTRQPQPAPADLLARYRAVLIEQGTSAAEADRRIRIIQEQGRRLEIERWNRILTSPTPGFNVKPNAFLVRVTTGMKPGRALDVGMGQGRNAIYLAQQGWEVTGFDPAEKAVAAAQATAASLGVKLTTSTVDDETFDFGREQWDLILLSYVGVRNLVPRVHASLRPGGVVVVEAFHRDATRNASIGGGVVFDSNELLKMFDGLRILVYEDAEAMGDFGQQQTTRVVRLLAMKPSPAAAR